MATQKRKRVTMDYSTDFQLGPDVLPAYKAERIHTKWGVDCGEKEYEERVRIVQYQIDAASGSRIITDIVQGEIKLLEKWVEKCTGTLVRIPNPNAQAV